MKINSSITIEKTTNTDNLVISLIEVMYINGKREFLIKNESHGVVIDSAKSLKQAEKLFEFYSK